MLQIFYDVVMVTLELEKLNVICNRLEKSLITKKK